MHWFCLQYVRSREDADEIVNDAFLTLWEKRDDINLDQSVKSLLYTIVRNKSLNLLKKRKIEISDMEDGFEIVSNDVSAVEALQAKETEQMVHLLIEQLPPKCKQIFILSRREYLSNKEVAAIMDISEKTVENQITIAIRFIKSRLNHQSPNNKSNSASIIVFPWILSMLLS